MTMVSKGPGSLVPAGGWKLLPTNPLTPDVGPAVQPIGQRVLADTQAMAEMLPVVRELTPDREGLVLRTTGPIEHALITLADTDLADGQSQQRCEYDASAFAL